MVKESGEGEGEKIKLYYCRIHLSSFNEIAELIANASKH